MHMKIKVFQPHYVILCADVLSIKPLTRSGQSRKVWCSSSGPGPRSSSGTGQKAGTNGNPWKNAVHTNMPENIRKLPKRQWLKGIKSSVGRVNVCLTKTEQAARYTSSSHALPPSNLDVPQLDFESANKRLLPPVGDTSVRMQKNTPAHHTHTQTQINKSTKQASQPAGKQASKQASKQQTNKQTNKQTHLLRTVTCLSSIYI